MTQSGFLRLYRPLRLFALGAGDFCRICVASREPVSLELVSAEPAGRVTTSRPPLEEQALLER